MVVAIKHFIVPNLNSVDDIETMKEESNDYNNIINNNNSNSNQINF